MLETVEIYSQKEKLPVTASVICMHGLGSDGHDLASLVPALNFSENLNIRFVFPHAPLKNITFNGGTLMPAWYDIKMSNFTLQEDNLGIQESAEKIVKLITQEKLRGIPTRKIFLAGFSQGAAMTFQVGLRYPERLAGLICLSGYLPLHSTLDKERTLINQDIPIFMAHGTLDTLVPYAMDMLSREKLFQLKYPVEWHEYIMGHQICTQEINDLRAWMMRILVPPQYS